MTRTVVGMVVGAVILIAVLAISLSARRRKRNLATSTICPECGFQMVSASFPRCPRCGENI